MYTYLSIYREGWEKKTATRRSLTLLYNIATLNLPMYQHTNLPSLGEYDEVNDEILSVTHALKTNRDDVMHVCAHSNFEDEECMHSVFVCVQQQQQIDVDSRVTARCVPLLRCCMYTCIILFLYLFCIQSTRMMKRKN